MTNYGIFFTGLASTPCTVGLIDWNSGEKISEIRCRGIHGKEIRAHSEKVVKKLEKAYSAILNVR